MAKIFINYIHDSSTGQYKLLKEREFVFADLPWAVLDTEIKIKVPVVIPIRGIMQVVDRIELEKTHKLFKLAADENGNVFESENGGEVWYPKDTDISKLRYIRDQLGNGQIVMIADDESEPEKEQKTKKNAEVKSQPEKSKKKN